MKNSLVRTAGVAAALLVCGRAFPAQEEAGQAETSSVIATVNGFEITEEDVERRFMVIVMEQTRGRGVPPEQMADLRNNFRPQILEELIDDRLLDEDVVRAEVKMTDGEVKTILTRSFDGQLLRSNFSRDDFAERLKAAEGITIDELLARQAEDEALKQALLHVQLIKARYPDKVALTDEAIKQRYERDLATLYTKPEMVRASHILFGIDGMTDEEAKAKADAILIECRKEGADFAELAKANSTGPSAPQGGDLGFFPKEAMVQPFAEAAYAMQVGDISEPVKTQFGYHVILVTGRREATVIAFADASPSIRDELLLEKIDPLRTGHIAALREGAEIVYATAPTPQAPENG